ncbi:2c323bee-91bd-4a27-ae64-a1917a46cf7b [Thermothielavioides terrestris]|uniref:2c323bee-91bd-4a27-ae64-a1917a46cf7b n=1 Tax=Thermothielavioides terrestris TaxID=2587410 RepID=A0A3S4B530_9PEZI|nr:2c323bee-91bd-4a27-ae64-a1917a46cf7b [Thermothielavioides terrestris]
MNSASDNAL